MEKNPAGEHRGIEGCYNVFESARRQGVRRMVFASSNHAIGFHRRGTFIDTEVETRPDGRYGVSKVFGEALGRMYADKATPRCPRPRCRRRRSRDRDCI